MALREAEHRLQAAQLASDVATLDQLLDDRLIFTGPDGNCYGKQDDLDVHRSGRKVMTKVSEEDLTVPAGEDLALGDRARPAGPEDRPGGLRSLIRVSSVLSSDGTAWPRAH